MNSIDKSSIQRHTERRYTFHRAYVGIRSLHTSCTKIVILILALVSVFALYFQCKLAFESITEYFSFFTILNNIAFTFLSLVGLFFLFVLFGTPFTANKTREALLKAGITNYASEAPVLVSRRLDSKLPGITIWEFDPCGIPQKLWEDHKEYIEVALNVLIADFGWSNDKKYFYLYTAPPQSAFPEKIEWKPEYLSAQSFVLLLGQSLIGTASVDLTKIPHVLLGGSTGSGKSVLLKLMLMQAVEKGAVVHIADFKGGVDFSEIWHLKCDMCFDMPSLTHILTTLVSTLEERKHLFATLGYPNLDAYNDGTGEHLPRYILACDEVAEFLDKTGLSKDAKSEIDNIISQISTIARLGRAFGIHLILATQRPDATLIPGQIRNNLDGRICGRADNVLSQIILDNTTAADQIPKDSRGRFLMYDGKPFQAFWFDEKNWH